jgi:hypothetical protein
VTGWEISAQLNTGKLAQLFPCIFKFVLAFKNYTENESTSNVPLPVLHDSRNVFSPSFKKTLTFNFIVASIH